MPIRIPDALPAAAQLESENIFVMTEYRALHQDIRPLRVLLLNLMPTKIATETQIMRKLSNTPLQVEVDLLRTKTHEATHVSAGHLETFYRTFDDIRDIHYDGLIITGARALPDHGLVHYARTLYAAHLLGRAGRAVPSLRHPEVRPAGKGERRVRALSGEAAKPAGPRL